MMSSSKNLLSSQRNATASPNLSSQVSLDRNRTLQAAARRRLGRRIKQESSSSEEEKPRLLKLPLKGRDGRDSDSDLTDNSSGAYYRIHIIKKCSILSLTKHFSRKSF